jgi:hypothetical protein
MRLQYDDEFDLDVRLTFSGASRGAGGEPRRALPETVDEASCVPYTCRTCANTQCGEEGCVETNTCADTQCDTCQTQQCITCQTQCDTCVSQCRTCETDCGASCHTCPETDCNGPTCGRRTCEETCTCATECAAHCPSLLDNCND